MPPGVQCDADDVYFAHVLHYAVQVHNAWDVDCASGDVYYVELVDWNAAEVDYTDMAENARVVNGNARGEQIVVCM